MCENSRVLIMEWSYWNGLIVVDRPVTGRDIPAGFFVGKPIRPLVSKGGAGMGEGAWLNLG